MLARPLAGELNRYVLLEIEIEDNLVVG